ncbi:hypothetical protein B0T24DRAFT_681240 [Lasiosphaeria ovina]|uniref:Flavin reductase like domain-containing protein n=1 Tax=Lasiosphaeria ovina TaxID=92902 RepID=A0AAE0N3B6_9PEZI|nr:hypothetical protein B0T24DRAFT_681240 [Lasiosphaeria ovina]
MAAAENTAKWEEQIKRNPHPDFDKVQASRPPWDATSTFRYTQTAKPDWKFGDGANDKSSGSGSDSELAAGAGPGHVSIDPYAPGRPTGFNYKLLISAIVPRPIAFLSTRSADGLTTNLAPFSYFQLVAHDPPMFVIGFASALEAGRAKDSVRNLLEQGECVINIISEFFIEAANSTSINAPYGVSEWDVSGLNPVYDCETVTCARVREAIFSIEGKVESLREFESRATPGRKNATMATIEGTHFWAREDAINDERNIVDPRVLRPISRLGGITYGRLTEAFELQRPDFEKDLGGREGAAKLESKHPAAN